MNINQPSNQKFERINQPQYYRGNIDWITHDDFEDMEMSAIQDSAISAAIGFFGRNYNNIKGPQIQKSSNDGHVGQINYSKQVCQKLTAGYHLLQIKCIATGLLMVRFKQELAKSRNFFSSGFCFPSYFFIKRESSSVGRFLSPEVCHFCVKLIVFIQFTLPWIVLLSSTFPFELMLNRSSFPKDCHFRQIAMTEFGCVSV